jgi:GT2 family glycosyltransferase
MQRRLHSHDVPGIYVPDAKVWHYVPAARCSPEWALSRTYQHGLAVGVRMKHELGPTQLCLWQLVYVTCRALARFAEGLMELCALRKHAFALRRWKNKFAGVLAGLNIRTAS